MTRVVKGVNTRTIGGQLPVDNSSHLQLPGDKFIVSALPLYESLAGGNRPNTLTSASRCSAPNRGG